ncbi:MAG TPA: GNAT family N-acetyltransferase [Patescibacteria group bacterium]|nr:GNAT family N-acetyltransferase [Patescibacteria group bacterium]
MILPEFERPQNFTIIDQWNDDLIQKATEIYEQGLGQEYISAEDLKRYIAKSECIVIGAMVDSSLAGVMIAYPMMSEESEKYDRELYENKVPQIFQGRNVGLVKSVSVENKFRRRGIGTQLILESMQRLNEKGCDLFFAVSWYSGLKDSSPSIFESLEFIKAVKISDYWTEDSLKEGYMCPVDGNPCHCSAIFFFKNSR